MNNLPKQKDSGNESCVVLVDMPSATDSSNNKLRNDTTSITTLFDPSTGEKKDYMLVKSRSLNYNGTLDKTINSAVGGNHDIYEIQSLSPTATTNSNSGKKKSYGSYFVGSRVVSNGKLFVMTRIDPLFFVLYELSKSGVSNNVTATTSSSNSSSSNNYKWQPLEQLLVDVPEEVSNSHWSTGGLCSQINNICDMTDKLGDDLLLYKFSIERTLKWLKKKQERIFHTIKKQIMINRTMENTKQHKVNDQHSSNNKSTKNGAFNNSFNFDGEEEEVKNENTNDNAKTASTISEGPTPEQDESSTNDRLSKNESEMALRISIQIICEYLSVDWRNKLIKHLNMDLCAVDDMQLLTMEKEGDSNNRNGDTAKEMAKNPYQQNEQQQSNKNQAFAKNKCDYKSDNNLSINPKINVNNVGSNKSWGTMPGENDSDNLLQFTTGIGMEMKTDVSSNTCTGSGGSNSKENLQNFSSKAKLQEQLGKAKSAGLKRLAKVNTKGMKSLSSFFGAPKPKKQKI